MHNDDFIFKMSAVSLAYGDRVILKDVHLMVKPGEFWFMLGPNGVGKTTLLKTLLGILSPRGGKIDLHPKFAQREFIGFVPQRCDFNPSLPITVSEFVLLGLAGIRLRKQEKVERLLWALEKMQLKEMGQKNYWSLSGGQRQRALVARALVRRPGFLIADEPTKDLDLPAANALMESLEDLNRAENLTILFVTHDLTLAARYATHIALFVDGLVQVGQNPAILNPDCLERTYGVPVSVFEEPTGGLCVRLHRKEKRV
jgi:ABC-type cobalamin/Fe3+-siderophores transport system ATPase subunit